MNFNVMKKEQLIDLITNTFKYDKDISGMKRAELILLAKDLEGVTSIKEAQPEEVTLPAGFVRDEEVLVPTVNSETPAPVAVPDITSPEWTDFIMSLFTEDELVDGKYPSCDALRRVFEKIIGVIVSTDMQVIQPPDNNNGGRATVKCTLEFAPYAWMGTRVGTKKVSDVADCYYGNTLAPYCKHAAATAATMAEGRCLRKAMMIRTLTREEMQTPKGEEAKAVEQIENDGTPATDNQKHILTRMCQRSQIDIEKFLADQKVEAKNLDTLTQQEAQHLLRVLNNYQRSVIQGGTLVPDGIKSTNPTPVATEG
jgi:hypothetical protein